MADNTKILGAPLNLDLSGCFVTANGGQSLTSLSTIQTTADSAAAKVIELEQKIDGLPSGGGGGDIDTSNFLTKSDLNAPNGAVALNDVGDVIFPIHTAPKNYTTWLKYGYDKNSVPIKGVTNITHAIALTNNDEGSETRYLQLVSAIDPTNVRWTRFDTDNIVPTGNAVTNLGKSDTPFKDVFIANSPTITSDANTKNIVTSDISASDYAKLLDAVYSVKASLYTMKIAVENKGTDARTHAGFIAQQLESAVKSQGLDPAQFSFWCNSPVTKMVPNQIQKSDGTTDTIYEYELVKDDDGNQVYQQSLRYEELFVLLLEAVKVKLSAFEARLEALESK